MEEIESILKKTEGQISNKAGELLYTLAKNCKGKGVIVEIGSWRGGSTICLGKGSKVGNKVKVYAIDPYKNGGLRIFKELKKNIKNAKVDDIIVPIVKTSEEAAKDFNKPVELIFIDGNHEYGYVKLDFELWFPKLINGGIIAFHDTHLLGPKKVVEELVYKSKKIKRIGVIDSITFAKKVKQNSIKDRLRNRCALSLRNLFECIFKSYNDLKYQYSYKRVIIKD